MTENLFVSFEMGYHSTTCKFQPLRLNRTKHIGTWARHVGQCSQNS